MEVLGATKAGRDDDEERYGALRKELEKAYGRRLVQYERDVLQVQRHYLVKKVALEREVSVLKAELVTARREVLEMKRQLQSRP